MASKTVVELYDDMDGGLADETVRFALDGVEYEIDLSAEHAAALRDTLAVYIGHAHRPARRARRAEAPTPAPTPAPASTIRATPTTARNGRNGRNGSGGTSGKTDDHMTAEIRRLASESAQKVNQARAAAEATNVHETDAPTLTTVTEPVRPTPDQPAATIGPVPALVIPFMEAR